MAIFTAIAGAISAVGTFIAGLGAVGSFLLKTAVGIGLNLLAQAIAGKPKDPTFSINGTLQSGGDVPRSFILGRTATAGSLVWVNTWGDDGDTKNAYLTQVVALSDLPCGGFTELYVNNEPVGLDPNSVVSSQGDGNAAGKEALNFVKAFFSMKLGYDLDLLQQMPDEELPETPEAFYLIADALGMGSVISSRFENETVVAATPDQFSGVLGNIISLMGETPWVDPNSSSLGTPCPTYRKDGKDNLWVKFYDGTQTTVDGFLNGRASNGNRHWQSNRVGRGVAYAIVTAKVSGNMFSGIPSFKFALSGMPLYDPSKDSTVPGGSGSHRWNDPTTWGGDGDHNPAVQIYNLLRGIQYNGQWFYGLQGMSAARLPAANWITQINKCRDGGIYRSGGEIPIDAPLATAIEAILTSCQGRLSEIGGVYNIYVGEPDEPVASFTDGDIISTDEQSFTPFFGLADTINGIAATYPSPADGWSVKAAPPIYRTDLEVLAGNRRLMADVSLDFVPYPEQVQRLMKSALAEGQRARRHTLVLPPEYWPYAVPGNVFSWTSERNGYVNKWFRVDGAVDRANLDVMIDITEVDPSDFDWDSNTDYDVPVDGALGVLRPPPMPLVGWQVFPATIGQGGKELPSIRVAYPGQIPDMRAVRVQVRLDGETSAFFDGEIPYGDPDINDPQSSTTLFGTFAPDTDHEVRGILVPDGYIVTEWSEWLPVKTPNVWIYDVYGVDLDRLGDDIRGWQEWAGNGLREVERRLEEFDLWMADQDLGSAYARQQIRQQITATFDNARAEWRYDVDVVAAENYALAQRVEQLDAEVFDPDTGLPSVASAVEALSTYAGPDGTLAEALTALSASTTPGVVSEANLRMQASGDGSRIVFQTRHGGEGAWRGAAIGLDTPSDPLQPTRFWVDAQQFVIFDTSTDDEQSPFIFQDGVLTLRSMRAQTLTAARLESLDGLSYIDMSTGTIDLRFG